MKNENGPNSPNTPHLALNTCSCINTPIHNCTDLPRDDEFQIKPNLPETHSLTHRQGGEERDLNTASFPYSPSPGQRETERTGVLAKWVGWWSPLIDLFIRKEFEISCFAVCL